LDLNITKTRKNDGEKSPLVQEKMMGKNPCWGSNPRWGQGWGGILSPQQGTGQGSEWGRGRGLCSPSPTCPVIISSTGS